MKDKLILGTVQLGVDYGINNNYGKPNQETAFKILNTAWDNDIRILDTAEAYGTSQNVIGDFHNNYPEKKFKIISKLNPLVKVKKGDLHQVIEANLKILNIKYLHGYLFHNYANFKENEVLYKELVQLKQKLLINKIGVSLHTNEAIEDVLLNYPEFDIIQLPFNLLDNHSKRGELLLKAKSKSIEIHTRSAFLQGLFFKNAKNLTHNFNALKYGLETIEVIKKTSNIDTQTLCLQYVLQKKYIDKVLIGVDSAEQLLTNIKSSTGIKNIPNNDIDTINVKNSELLNPANWN